jgi:SsuE family FMN reductase
MSKHAVFISGSPQPRSRSARVAQAIAERLDAADVRLRRFGLSDFESSDLVYARGDGRVIQHFLDEVKSASAVILSTPVYKATYSGGLKLLIDIIPPDALRGKTVLAVATGRIGRHFQSAQRAFDDLYRFFDVGFVIPPVFVLDEQVQSTNTASRVTRTPMRRSIVRRRRCSRVCSAPSTPTSPADASSERRRMPLDASTLAARSGARDDALFMRLALELARQGTPAPNPHVGAVVVQAGQIVGVGHHQRAGEAHAEALALTRAGARARGGTLYVTLEPCNHHGRTPPCVDAILASGVRRVVIGCADANPHVRGGGADALRRAGLEVTLGPCTAEAEQLIAEWTAGLSASPRLTT